MDRRLVARRRVVDASQHVEVVDPLSKKRQMLAALVAGNAGGDLLELAANLRRRVRFQIPRVVVRTPALKQDDDRSLGWRTGGTRASSISQLRQTERSRQGKRADGDAAIAEQTATVERRSRLIMVFGQRHS